MMRLGMAALLVCGWATPTAAAGPDSVPDLSGFTPADVRNYGAYYNYPATYGVHFLTPGGYRCRITHTYKANPNIDEAYCWGDLPGTTSNSVFVWLGIKADPANFADGDLSGPEEYYDPSSGPGQKTVSPASYKPLPAGSKLTYSGSTCAVTDALTVCVVGDHGFVLKPEGSQVF